MVLARDVQLDRSSEFTKKLLARSKDVPTAVLSDQLARLSEPGKTYEKWGLRCAYFPAEDFWCLYVKMHGCLWMTTVDACYQRSFVCIPA